MSVAFIDTSCLTAIALTEPGAQAMGRRLASFDRLMASPLLEAELRSVLRREHIRTTNADAWMGLLNWTIPDRSLRAEIATVLAAGYARGADCWHLASALYFSPDASEISFLTLDKRQAEVARALGFRT